MSERHEEYVYSQDYFSSNVPLWSRVLTPYRDMPGVHGLELGSFEGRSSVWLLENVLTHNSSRLTCVDHFFATAENLKIWGLPSDLDYEANFDHNVRKTGAADRVRKVRADWRVALAYLPLGEFAFISIDIVMTAPDALTAMAMSWDLLRADGILLFDNCNVDAAYRFGERTHKSAISAFMDVFSSEYHLLHSGDQLVVRKRPPDRDETAAAILRRSDRNDGTYRKEDSVELG